jgi:NAD(P)-dependent dehydrogenase (short-subunit alcohol dehydrogenase family)
LGLELARHQIRVNAIAPGYIRTEMNDAFFSSEPGQDYIKQKMPMRRLGNVDELVGPLLLLASDAGSFMTGSVITVDGGQVINAL